MIEKPSYIEIKGRTDDRFGIGSRVRGGFEFNVPATSQKNDFVFHIVSHEGKKLVRRLEFPKPRGERRGGGRKEGTRKRKKWMK